MSSLKSAQILNSNLVVYRGSTRPGGISKVGKRKSGELELNKQEDQHGTHLKPQHKVPHYSSFARTKDSFEWAHKE